MRYALFLLIFTLWPTPSKAQQTIQYAAPHSFREKEITAAYKQEINSDDPFIIAKTDLNDDFINEYVLRPANCTKGQICSHGIMVYMDEKPLLIGEFDAHKIAIAFKKDYGVKRLIVYNQAHNDFSSKLARWDPQLFQYKLPKN
ncbi:MAG: hypothetical protein AAGB32_05540 [Pseudomonadota bacterium]